jgi:hypothetical protein
MEINKNLKLVLRNIYLCDIEACHYNIMKKLGLDLEGIDETNKLERNIQIGKMMRRNPRLTKLLRSTTEAVITEYIRQNNLKEDEILIRQYDGILTTRTISVNDIGGIPFKIREHFSIFITSIDRKKYLAFNDSYKKVVIKGIPFRNEKIDNIYKKLCTDVLNSASKKVIFEKLQKIKDFILNSDDPSIFGIPDKDNRVNIYLKGYGEMVISSQTLKIMDPDDIDKERYFRYYLEPFTKSIVVEFI